MKGVLGDTIPKQYLSDSCRFVVWDYTMMRRQQDAAAGCNSATGINPQQAADTSLVVVYKPLSINTKNIGGLHD